ncbi:ABC transporter substrate-binding protein [Thermodesulfobacteriota bacterium]
MKLTIKIIILAIIANITIAATAFSYERIIILYGAVSPIIKELSLSDKVVGVSKSDTVFTKVTKLGSHLRPNIELINALEPDIILTGSKRTFNEEMVSKVNAKVLYFDPQTLDEVLEKITELGRLFGEENKAKELVKSSKEKLKKIKPLTKKPTVIYEISAQPLRIAGKKSIVTSIINAAGGENVITIEKKHTVISPELILKSEPDYYFYQTGPMNKNPTPVKERDQFTTLKSMIVNVDQYEFTRAGLNVFDAVIKMNQYFLGENNE